MIKKCLLKTVALFLIFSTLIICTACKNTDSEDGPHSGYLLPTNICAIKGDKIVFDIDDVTLDFYYGVHYSSDAYKGIMLLEQQSFPTFDVLFKDEKGKEYIVKHVEENFVSEKYRVQEIYDENYNVIDTVFNHSETLTVPKEVFIYNHGYFWFEVRGDNKSKVGTKNQTITGKCIHYKVKDDKVILSNYKFKS